MLVDTHAHIDKYGERIAQAIRQINEFRILTISVSMDFDSYQSTVRISELSAYIKPAFGIHHWEAPKFAPMLAELDTYLKQSAMIGEIGLDYYFVKDKSFYSSQRTVFEYQCEWAARLGKIVNLHGSSTHRCAEPRVLCLWGLPHAIDAGIMHCKVENKCRGVVVANPCFEVPRLPSAFAVIILT